MSFELVKNYLTERGYGDRAREFTVSSATVELAAAALGCEGARIAKTLSFKTPEGVVLIVAAGDAKVDNHKYKEKPWSWWAMRWAASVRSVSRKGSRCIWTRRCGGSILSIRPAAAPTAQSSSLRRNWNCSRAANGVISASSPSLRRNKNMGSFPRVTADPGDFLRTGDGFSVEKSSGPAQKMVF